MNITVIGTGYVGLVSGACLADLGHNVICVDIDEQKIERLKEGILPIYEQGLESLVKRNTREGRLVFTTDLAESVQKTQIIFVCVGTPSLPSGEADLSYIEMAFRQIVSNANDYKLIVQKSTVPVQTAERLLAISIKDLPGNGEIEIISNPEFLREGRAVSDFMNPDRIVIGSASNRAAGLMAVLYGPLNAPIVFVDNASAEMIKYVSNCFLALKISFINVVARICEETGADIKQVINAVGLDKRIGKSFLEAGVGYGGSCFPKDVEAFIQTAENQGIDFKLLKEVENINKGQRNRLVQKILAALDGNVQDKKIAILGLAFKPGTDDMRQAPSLSVVEQLQKKGAKIAASDPIAIEAAKKLMNSENIVFDINHYEVAKDADVLVILTEWNEYKNLDFVKLKQLLKQPIIIDGRNLYDPSRLESLGFKYYSFGQQNIDHRAIHLIYDLHDFMKTQKSA